MPAACFHSVLRPVAMTEFDPGSLVLTAFCRVNGGTIRGDRDEAAHFLNSFSRDLSNDR